MYNDTNTITAKQLYLRLTQIQNDQDQSGVLHNLRLTGVNNPAERRQSTKSAESKSSSNNGYITDTSNANSGISKSKVNNKEQISFKQIKRNQKKIQDEQARIMAEYKRRLEYEDLILEEARKQFDQNYAQVKRIFNDLMTTLTQDMQTATWNSVFTTTPKIRKTELMINLEPEDDVTEDAKDAVLEATYDYNKPYNVINIGDARRQSRPYRQYSMDRNSSTVSNMELKTSGKTILDLGLGERSSKSAKTKGNEVTIDFTNSQLKSVSPDTIAFLTSNNEMTKRDMEMQQQMRQDAEKPAAVLIDTAAKYKFDQFFKRKI